MRISEMILLLQERKKLRIIIAVFMVLFACVLLFGVIFINNTWNSSITESKNEAVQLAEISEAMLSKLLINSLDTNLSILGKDEYKEIKNSLMELVSQKKDIRFAYVYMLKGKKIYLLADSEPANSKDYSPPGQEYTEAAREYFIPFEKGDTIIANGLKDRWGTWSSVIVPVRNRNSGEIIAAFGIDYPDKLWNQNAFSKTLQSVILFICIVILFISIFIVIVQNISLRIEKKSLCEYEEKLKEREALFKAVFEQATVGIAIVHNDKYIRRISENIPSVNPMFEKILGRSMEELEKISWIDITHPDDLQLDLDCFEKFKSGEIKGYDIEKRYIKPDGSAVWVHMIISPLYFNGSSYCSHLCIIEDISGRMEMEKNLCESERSKAALLYNLPGMAYRCNFDRDWTMQFVSEGCYKLTGYKPESLLYNKDISFNSLINPKYQKYLWEKWELAIKERSKLKEEYELITASGESKWVFEQGIGIYDKNDNVIALEGLIIDITERKKQELKLKYINSHDELTGLYNRRYFNEFIEGELKKEREEKSSVILVNLKKFGFVNLTLGYTFAENMIRELAENLSAVCNDKCKLFHVSRDTFVFYVSSYKTKDELVKFNDFIIGIINATFVSKTIGASIGIMEIDNSEYDADHILKNGLIAAQNVNEYQHLGYAFFDKKMEEKLLREARIKNELELAVLNTGDTIFYLEYQPVLDLKTNSIHSFEALARLKSSKLGNVSPAEFIPIAEDTQLIIPLGKIIIRHALRFLRELEYRGYDNVSVALNISIIQLLRDDFIPELVNIIMETKANPHRIIIEITESLFFNNYQEINTKIDAMKAMGIEISIDDFGTGYSSLARQRELNVNCLKIDKYFIDKLMIIDEDEIITGDIISMAHKIGHYVVAEGVEHEKQKQYLLKNGCDLLQGYLFSKPVSEDAAIEFLKKELKSCT